jgi:hypothetical protein
MLCVLCVLCMLHLLLLRRQAQALVVTVPAELSLHHRHHRHHRHLERFRSTPLCLPMLQQRRRRRRQQQTPTRARPTSRRCWRSREEREGEGAASHGPAVLVLAELPTTLHARARAPLRTRAAPSAPLAASSAPRTTPSALHLHSRQMLSLHRSCESRILSAGWVQEQQG